VDITAESLSITAASVGSSTDALDISVATLTLNTTAGAAYLNEASALTVASSTTGLLSLSAVGATVLTQVNATGSVTVNVSAGSLTVGSISASGLAVGLTASGAVLDGDAGVDITAQSLNITAASVGTAIDSLDTDVASLTLNVTGAAYVNEANSLAVSGSTVGGLFSLNTAGNTSLTTLGVQTANGDVVEFDFGQRSRVAIATSRV
jgi:hypothetical protein